MGGGEGGIGPLDDIGGSGRRHEAEIGVSEYTN
jgi:hypothetical protein